MTIHFPDVSNWQAGLSLDGAVACIAKASEGTGYRDPYYVDFRSQAERLGIPFAAYHWISTADIDSQARFAYGIVGSDTPMMWDCEDDGSTVERILAITEAYRKLGGIATLVYLPKWWWSGHLGSPDLRPLHDAGLSLISSHYTTYSDNGPGWNPYGGVTPSIWQYTSSKPFNGMNIDFNAFKGTVEQLAALWQSGGYDVDSENTWKFIETGERPVKPDTFTPEGGYTSVPNNWLGETLGKTQQDARRTREAVDAFAAKLEAMEETLTQVVSLVRRGNRPSPSD